jgi:hypothetical protein
LFADFNWSQVHCAVAVIFWVAFQQFANLDSECVSVNESHDVLRVFVLSIYKTPLKEKGEPKLALQNIKYD